MAKLERRLPGLRDTYFDELHSKIYHGMIEGSISCEVNSSSDFFGKNSRCSVMVFERYSAFGGNRVSLNVTMYQEGSSDIRISAIASGGSRAIFAKINTVSEEAFLCKLAEILDE